MGHPDKSCEDLDEDDCCAEESFMGGGEGGGESMMSEGGAASLHGESSASSGTSSGESFTGETPMPQMGGEGGGGMNHSSTPTDCNPSASACAELTEDECWTVFYDWTFEQCWGPSCESTGFEQFQPAQAKLAELGLSSSHVNEVVMLDKLDAPLPRW